MHQGLGVAGQYLAKPDKCPDFLYNLMLMCHRPQPYDRITMVYVIPIPQLQYSILEEQNDIYKIIGWRTKVHIWQMYLNI